MLKSMTGFGRCEKVSVERKITIEMKGVNHRFCDISVKLPKKLSFFEAGIRNLLKHYISRGKVDVFLAYEDYTGNRACVKYNENIAREYMENLNRIEGTFHLENDIKVSTLSYYPEVFILEEQTIDEEELWSFLEQALREATQGFVETRIAEGNHLKEDLLCKLIAIQEYVCAIEERSPKVVSEYRERLTNKVKELLGDVSVNESILVTEVTVFADKICVDEETVRLKSHIENMKLTLNESDSIGRKLDFIAQEMNREANTILSKSNDLEVSNFAIDLKTEIEKVREQIQNIE